MSGSTVRKSIPLELGIEPDSTVTIQCQHLAYEPVSQLVIESYSRWLAQGSAQGTYGEITIGERVARLRAARK